MKEYTFPGKVMLELDGIKGLVEVHYPGQEPRVRHCSIKHFQNSHRADFVVEHDVSRQDSERVSSRIILTYSGITEFMGTPIDPDWVDMGSIGIDD